jgi:acetolactate synthase I/II/III large subunit
LILPADAAWNEGSGPAVVPPAAQPAPVSPEAVTEAARVLRSGESTLLLVTGRALCQERLDLAGRIAAKTGARLIAQGSNARTQRGRGRGFVKPVPSVVDQAVKVLAGLNHLIFVLLSPPDAVGHVLARPEEDLIGALEALADALGPGAGQRRSAAAGGRGCHYFREPGRLAGIIAGAGHCRHGALKPVEASAAHSSLILTRRAAPLPLGDPGWRSPR